MAHRQTARLALRTATSASHERVDALFGGFDLTEARGYGDFLAAQAGAFLPLEAAIAVAGPEQALPDWDRRQRASLLRADLAALGRTVTVHPAPIALATAPAVLGAVYVLEGSRLGGAMLARSVPDDFPKRFLGASDAGLWRSLIQMLDSALVSANDLRIATDSARAAFDLFAASAERQLEITERD